MTDRELLEMAAKAAELDAEWHEEDDGDQEAKGDGMWLKGSRTVDNSKYWNPLTNDGDALRLAVSLKLDIEWQSTREPEDDWVEVYRATPGGSCMVVSSQEKDYRRAIVEAAAEIGKAMS